MRLIRPRKSGSQRPVAVSTTGASICVDVATSPAVTGSVT